MACRPYAVKIIIRADHMEYSRFVEKARKYMIENDLIARGDGIVVGLSGGADSMSLLLMLNSLKKEFDLSLVAVHLNHMIRGSEADRDESFVRESCERLGVELVTFRKDIPALAKEKGLTEEEAGRLMRYELFEEVRQDRQFTKIAVAHNSDDLAETVVFNMARGSSIRGLTGIQARRGCIIRPLLGTSRREIEAYLAELGQDYVTDSTNNETEYSRNLIRHEILPRMAELNAGAKEHMIEAAEDLSELYGYIAAEAVRVELRCEKVGRSKNSCNSVTVDDNANAEKKCDIYVGTSESGSIDTSVSSVRLKIDDLEGKLRLVRYEVYLRALEKLAGRRKDITRQHLSLIDGLKSLESGKQLDMPYDICVRRSYGELVFEKRADGTEAVRVFVVGEGDYSFGAGVFSIRICEYTENIAIPREDFIKMFDYDRICGKLCFRYPEQGDYIRVTADGSKKLSRLFTDMKMDREERKRVPVLSSENEVIWAVGCRISEAFKVKESTKKVMIVAYKEQPEGKR